MLSESHTCERPYRLLCDLDPNVVAIYTQVRIQGVQRQLGNGRHVSNASLDLLVFHPNRIKIVECKTLDKLEALVTKPKSDWIIEGANYVHGPYRNWAEANGLSYETYSPPHPCGRYLSNIDVLHASLAHERNDQDHGIIARVIALCKQRGPQSITAVLANISACERRHLIYGLADKTFSGTLLSEVLESGSFLVGLPNTGVEEIDSQRLQAIAILQRNPVVRDEFLVHPAKYREIAVKRLNRILAMRAGTEPWTRRYHALSHWLESINANPEEMLRLLIPNYAACGNYGTRLLCDQLDELDVYKKAYEDGIYASRKKALAAYKKKETPTPNVSDTTVRKWLAAADPAKQAFATGGFRGFQSERPRSSPLDRTIPSQLSGHTVHLDATLLDVRSGPIDDLGIPAQRAWIYVARDTRGKPLARSFVLGNARTNVVAVLWRSYVYRNGELPRIVHTDRGPDNLSTWHKDFARGNFDLDLSPTAAARYNQPAEDLLNHINLNVSHWLEGNTLLDRLGRAADGKFKSIKTARLGIQLICQFVDEYLFDEVGWTRKVSGETIDEDYLSRRAAFGMGGGLPCLYDDEFLIRTSIPLARYKATEKDGIRTTDGCFLERTMQSLLRRERPVRVVRDCVDPSILYVQIKKQWFRALRADVWKMQDLSFDERLAWLMTERASVSANRAEREARERDRVTKMLSETERSLNQYQAPSTSRVVPQDKKESLDQWVDGSLGDSEPFEEV